MREGEMIGQSETEAEMIRQTIEDAKIKKR